MKTTNKLVAAFGAFAVLATSAATGLADPCGMVPPVTMIESDPIVRVGDQKTYVSHYKGVETMVLRPGFKGKVDEFGMLIPFPSVPAVRKVSDNIFPHIAAAIDPPEVLAYVQQVQGGWGMSLGGSAGGDAPSAAQSAPMRESTELRYDEVRVVKQEAVGMYDVAVLAAGSSKALKKWMDKNTFKYPEGMDDVVDEYVEDKWVFVAIKTKVGQKKGVNPKPGMKTAKSKLPKGATFSGHVQAMGFRFKTEELVVPMRLSAFNKGKLDNIVYILTDDEVRIKKIPKRYVVRQVSGDELYENLTKPLPLRVIGGEYSQLTQWQKNNLVNQRRSEPHNGLAKAMFAADMLAIRSGKLSNKVEEKEKELLAIGERLGMRGAQVDALHSQVLKKKRDRAVRKSLKDIKKLTLTIVDGEFKRDVIAEDNLLFASYKVPKKRNTPEKYDARHQGPKPARGGKLYRGEAASLELQDAFDRPDRSWFNRFGGIGFGMLFVFGGLMLVRRRRDVARWWMLVLLAGCTAAGTTAHVSADEPAKDDRTTDELVEALGDKEDAQQAIATLAAHGKESIDPLLDELVDTEDDLVKGWAIVALSEIGGEEVDEELRKIHESTGYKLLVRTWAAAARMDMAKDLDALLELAPLVITFPALDRPLKLRVAEHVAGASGWKGAEQMLDAVTRAPQLAQSLYPALIEMGPSPLVGAMVKSDKQTVRQMAAAYLPAVKGEVAQAVTKAYKFKKGAKKVPWDGGALYVPGVNWPKEDASALVDNLIRWHLWAELNDKDDVQKQIHNNLQAWQLVNGAGYKNPGWQPVSTERWLGIWGEVKGRTHIRSILSQQGVRSDKRWRTVLSGIDE